jgi:murein DD-endopeptidase MepM/ murein hydrolase activator NlpD
VPVRSRPRLLQADGGPRLQDEAPSVTVPPMAAAPSAQSRAARRARRRTARARPAPVRRRRFAVLVVVAGCLVGTLIVTAFGQGSPTPVPQTLPPPASRLAPTGPPTPMTVALHGTLRVQLPIAQSTVTAIGYHAANDGGLPLTPLGHQANEGALSRLAHKLFGGGHGPFPYYQLSSGARDVLDVGAPPGTDVYAPVDGTVIGISNYVLDGRAYGSRIDIQPAAAPSLVVTVTQLKRDPALTVGATVTASGTKLGRVIDLSGVEKQALAQYTQDAGNHVSVELHPAATLTP